ncbi:MAG: UDP-N-acetylmuramate dehydrogenase [Gammaproteobacteria bacterium]|nr:UDP-N-acetylmuramate dehydrogenase [Gammaproteobacteria bacterium]
MMKVEKGVLLSDVSLKPYSYWKIGGNAERFYWPHNLQDLSQFLKQVPANDPITFIGLGSNILVMDAGVEGTVILTQGALKEMTVIDDNKLRVEAGVACAQVARFAARHNRVDGEFFCGIPGTMGGALFMNAGAFGGETWQRVIEVETIDRTGVIRKRPASEFSPHYRHTDGLKEDEWFVAATLQFEIGDGALSLEKIKALLEKRAQTQPTGQPSCGSTFRNPPGNFAAKLIEASGLKGTQIGGLQVSEKHANFLVNVGNASSQDVLDLMALVHNTVLEKFGIDLIPEVKIIGKR